MLLFYKILFVISFITAMATHDTGTKTEAISTFLALIAIILLMITNSI